MGKTQKKKRKSGLQKSKVLRIPRQKKSRIVSNKVEIKKVVNSIIQKPPNPRSTNTRNYRQESLKQTLDLLKEKKKLSPKEILEKLKLRQS
eukprot:snap_masked-scaffold_9-processed-gene-13.28-mRNA-1 protein AED:1.00 eAED:1.00 QI:0/-1/0/0/-1/1/1/0/90